MEKFETELCFLINKHCIENDSNTPDFILAKYMKSCLDSFHEAVKQRESWYGKVDYPGANDEIQRIRRAV